MISICGQFIPPSSGAKYVDYKDVCYLSQSTFDANSDFYSRFIEVGEVPNSELGNLKVIGTTEARPVAAVVPDSAIEEMISYMNGTSPDRIVPFIMAVVAIDAGLIATMWAVAVSG